MKPWLPGAMVIAAAACQERLVLPSQCPALCPGEGLTIRDTVLLPVTGRDSTYTEYVGANEITALLVSNGLPAGEARSWAIFPRRPDSVFVLGIKYAYTIDSAVISVNLTARDTAVRNLEIAVHRIPLPIDTTITLADLDSRLTPETQVFSAPVPDTLALGPYRLRVPDTVISRFDPDETDTTRFAIGFRITAPVPTGIRLGSNFSAEGGPIFVYFGTAPTTDTTLRTQAIRLPADTANYVIEPPPLSSPDALFLGGKSGSRTLLRFNLPAFLKDSATIIRATLELTPTGPLVGLPNDPAQLQIRPILLDVGAKSPAVGTTIGLLSLTTGAAGVQSIEVQGPVSTWFGPAGLPSALLLGITPEGGTFSRPEFFSSRTPESAPRLRITYALSSHPGFP